MFPDEEYLVIKFIKPMPHFQCSICYKLVMILIFLDVTAQAKVIKMTSPGGNVSSVFQLESDGEVFYSAAAMGDVFIKKSSLGVVIEGRKWFEANILLHVDSTTVDETWEPVLGEEATIRNHYKEYVFHLCDLVDKDLHYKIIFRLFDDGLGFRYEFPEQHKLTYFVLKDELTEFALSQDCMAFWLPGDYEEHSLDYQTTRISKITGLNKSNGFSNNKTAVSDNLIQTPLLLKSPSGLYINIHEAALIDYPAMNLKVDPVGMKLKVNLTADAVGNKAYLQTPCFSPWRTVIACKKAGDILASRLILNLNTKRKNGDYSWIKPIKSIGVWREMRLGRSTWSYSDKVNVALISNYLPSLGPNGKHGANEVNVKKYLDFAAGNGFNGVLVEGWNLGWEDWYGHWKERVFDFVTPYPDFNIKAISEYAQSRNIHLLMHHETAGSVADYERSLDTALTFMRTYGYPFVQTSYTGRIIPRGEQLGGQWMSSHYHRTADKLMRKKLMWNNSSMGRPTGLSRTYPNILCEGVVTDKPYGRQSYGVNPDLHTILPFTKSVGGPIFFPAGILQPVKDESGDTHLHTTLARQLALFITLYSPFQLAGDLPENYELFKDAFRFIKEVAMDWSRTLYLDAQPGEFLYVARKEKHGDRWFVGAITDQTSRSASLPLKFLDAGTKYKATIYADGAGAHFKTNPTAYKITEVLVDSRTKLPIYLAPGGGTAVSLQYASAAEIKKLPKLSGTFLKSWKRK